MKDHTFDMGIPVIDVGIISRKEVSFCFNDDYVVTASGLSFRGEQQAVCRDGKILFCGNMYDELLFEPMSFDATFDLRAVTIGVNFHWQRNEDQRFFGSLKLLAAENEIVVINKIDVERYLCSVISSEMNAAAPEEFLKVHAVISRSWLLAQLSKKKLQPKTVTEEGYDGDNMYVRWYDREDHQLFDVCADDHCQRYQGITRSANSAYILRILQATFGEIISSNGEICDARFSKCCGGITEEFEYCWNPVHYRYLSCIRDYVSNETENLTDERNADRWIRNCPEAFCNTSDHNLLATILNNYDRETKNFYRWKVSFRQKKLSDIVSRKSGKDFGDILNLIPLKRGKSGRIELLNIVGSKRSLIVGKELEIRRLLSETHLYSSAFVVDRTFKDGNSVPVSFTLHGAGWGHGVGLCQIGAAVMSSKGYGYKEILSHYFPGSVLEKLY